MFPVDCGGNDSPLADPHAAHGLESVSRLFERIPKQWLTLEELLRNKSYPVASVR